MDWRVPTSSFPPKATVSESTGNVRLATSGFGPTNSANVIRTVKEDEDVVGYSATLFPAVDWDAGDHAGLLVHGHANSKSSRGCRDVAAGSTPIAYGDWSQAYLVVTREPSRW
jgi:hypothetical protein